MRNVGVDDNSVAHAIDRLPKALLGGCGTLGDGEAEREGDEIKDTVPRSVAVAVDHRAQSPVVGQGVAVMKIQMDHVSLFEDDVAERPSGLMDPLQQAPRSPRCAARATSAGSSRPNQPRATP